MFLLVCGGRFKSFYERVPANLDKRKVVVHDRHATGELSFSLTMSASGSQSNRIEQNVPYWIWKNTWVIVMKVTKYN